MEHLKDYNIYLLADGNGEVFHFQNYRRLNGEIRRLLETETAEGHKIWKRVTLRKGSMLQVHKSDKKLNEFLQQHPNCPESDEFTGKVAFYLFNPEKDAENALESILLETEAINAAKELEGKRLLEIAALCGMNYTLSQESQCKNAVIRFAKSNPQRVLDAIQTPDKQAHIVYIVRDAIAKGNIVKENSVFKFAGNVLGIDEDGIVATLQTKAELLELIERRNSIGNEDAPAKVGRGRKTQ